MRGFQLNVLGTELFSINFGSFELEEEPLEEDITGGASHNFERAAYEPVAYEEDHKLGFHR